MFKMKEICHQPAKTNDSDGIELSDSEGDCEDTDDDGAYDIEDCKNFVIPTKKNR